MSEANGITVQTYQQTIQGLQRAIQVYQTALSSRAQFAAEYGKAFGGDRDYYEVLGYNRNPTIDTYFHKFKRQDIAARIVKAYPDETWRLPPLVYEDKTKQDAPFDLAWKDMEKRLRLIHMFHRADILACLGQFSILFLGFNDAVNIDGLAGTVRRGTGRTIGFVSPYSERHVEIVQFDEQINSPRFGMPLIYEIDFDRGGMRGDGNRHARMSIGKKRVNWERVIHFADGVLENDIYGTPKLEGVLNLLDDLMKVVGGGGEMFWRTARKDLIAQVHPDANFSPADIEATKERLEDYVHDLNRTLLVGGAEVKSLSPEVASPRDHVEVIGMMIAGALGIPQRILFGSERGNQASTQDEGNWVNQNVKRQTDFAEPVMRQYIDRCISTGVMLTPSQGVDGYTIEWQPLFTEDEGKKAATASTYSTAINTYASGQGSYVVPIQEFRETFLGLDPESPYETDEIIDARESEDDDDIGEGEEGEGNAGDRPDENGDN